MQGRKIVSAVRAGQSLRAVARRFGVGKSTVQRWVRRARGKRLDRVDFSPRPSRPQRTNRTPQELEDLVLDLRRELKDHSPLGEHGAPAIRRELLERHVQSVPSVRTLGRILLRRGALDGQRRMRHPAPPRGWYLPLVAEGQREVDCLDLIEDLRIQDGPLVDVLTDISLHGRLAAAWPLPAQATAKATVQCLILHWLAHGVPHYAQFDNDTRFQGAHHHPDSISRVMRLCLALEVTPVFTPPRETGFQASAEHFNRRWEDAVWKRFHHQDLPALCEQSGRFIRAHRLRYASHMEHAPARRPLPRDFRLDLQTPPSGCLMYLRRCNERGMVSLLGHTFAVDGHWPYRLVRCEVDLHAGRIRFFALRRRDPGWQPLLNEVTHRIPNRRFRE